MGRVAVVTGANKGIGLCIAQQLVASGLFAHVVLGCRDKRRGEEAARATGASFLQLEVGDADSHAAFAKALHERYGRLDVLVNNAAIAFKQSDPTPFHKQTKPTLDINFRGTVDLTEQLLPLLLDPCVDDARVVNVASMAGRLGQLSTPLQARFTAEDLTLPALSKLVDQFEADVAAGAHASRGWNKSNYGLSKLALISATRVLARTCAPRLKVNACCPGYCRTDMSSNRGGQPPEVGARNAVILATMPCEECPSGAFYQNEAPSAW